MRFLPDSKLCHLALEPHERLLLDCWYGSTHDKSLDSYRVKCLNARVAVAELCDELAIGRLDDPELKDICGEVLDLLASDPIVPAVFPHGLDTLRPLLENPPTLPGSSQKKDKKEGDENQTRLRNLKFAAADLKCALDDRYFSTMCNQLKAACDNKDASRIMPLTKSILTDLVANGWTLNALFDWYHKFVAPDGRSFSENLDFMLRQFKRQPEQYQVYLRISGGRSIRELSRFSQFEISRTASIDAAFAYEESFLTPDDYSVFAKGVFPSVDFTAAAINARECIEPLLDWIRFEFEPRLLEIERECLVIRPSDGKRMIISLNNPVPNPVETNHAAGFENFSDKLSRVLSSHQIDIETTNRIRTALSRYRAGRDSFNYSDKFLNWWMGLETLANVGGTKIGRTVTENISYAMLTGYLFRLLRDFLITLKYLKPSWKPEYTPIAGVSSFPDLDVGGLVALIQHDIQSHVLIKDLESKQILADRCQQFHEWLSDPKKLADQLESHHLRLKWHVSRLYRIRCCLVHGDPVRFRLALYAANVEYYLKTTLVFALDAMYEYPHVGELSALFQRSKLMWTRQLEALRAGRANTATIKDSVFASVISND